MDVPMGPPVSTTTAMTNRTTIDRYLIISKNKYNAMSRETTTVSITRETNRASPCVFHLLFIIFLVSFLEEAGLAPKNELIDFIPLVLTLASFLAP
jgi:hypothetical protein